MNPKISKVTVSAIMHATEDPDKINAAMQRIGLEPEARVERRRATGHYGNEIQTVRIIISNTSRAERFFDQFWSRVSPSDRTEMIHNLGSYLDESGHLHIRIDKQEAINEKVVLGQKEPIRIEISFDFQGILDKRMTALIGKKLEELVS